MTKNNALSWYNKLSLVHDLLSFNDWPYRDARKQTIELLDLQAGDTVIDFFCGTGINFAPILEKIGKDGRLIGIDGSSGMLSKAKKRIEKAGWDQKQIQLFKRRNWKYKIGL